MLLLKPQHKVQCFDYNTFSRVQRVDGWLRFNSILSTQVVAISCLRIGLDCAVFYVPANTV